MRYEGPGDHERDNYQPVAKQQIAEHRQTPVPEFAVFPLEIGSLPQDLALNRRAFVESFGPPIEEFSCGAYGILVYKSGQAENSAFQQYWRFRTKPGDLTVIVPAHLYGALGGAIAGTALLLGGRGPSRDSPSDVGSV